MYALEDKKVQRLEKERSNCTGEHGLRGCRPGYSPGGEEGGERRHGKEDCA
jgi:hypothetical protein